MLEVFRLSTQSEGGADLPNTRVRVQAPLDSAPLQPHRARDTYRRAPADESTGGVGGHGTDAPILAWFAPAAVDD